MALNIQTAQMGVPRILVRFGRMSDRHNPAGGKDWRDIPRGSWFDGDVSSRGL